MTTLQEAAMCKALEYIEGATAGLLAKMDAIEALKAALEQHERQQSSAYQRGYLDGMAKPCTNCADYKAMYGRVWSVPCGTKGSNMEARCNALDATAR